MKRLALIAALPLAALALTALPVDAAKTPAAAVESPRADAAFKSARLGFAQGQLARLDYTDALDQRTVIAFSGWTRNPAFAADTFKFVPPKGVDVIGG